MLLHTFVSGQRCRQSLVYFHQWGEIHFLQVVLAATRCACLHRVFERGMRSQHFTATFLWIRPRWDLLGAMARWLVGHQQDPKFTFEVRRQGWIERCWWAGGKGWDGMEREEAVGGWVGEWGWGGTQQLAPFFFFFFFLSLSLVTISVSPIWWKSNSTLALIMWQLEFTYLVNPASGFRFQLISLWLLHPLRGWWEQGGGGEPAVWVRRIQYDGEGGGRGSHTWRTEMAKMPAQHIQIDQAGRWDSTCLPFPLTVVREQSAKYSCSFTSSRRHSGCVWARVTAAYACTPLCLPAWRSAGCPISHLQARQRALSLLLFTLLCAHASVCDTHIRACIYVCVSHTKKRCILIRSRRPFRGSNPPGCDFPPLVLRGWGDWDC